MIKYLRYFIATEYGNGELSIRTNSSPYKDFNMAKEECAHINKLSDYKYSVFKATIEKVEDGNPQK